MKSIASILGIIAISLFAFAANQTERTITGKITDDKGAAIAGATIKIIGAKTATTSKQDGTFSIQTTKAHPRLQIVAIGYTTQTITIKDENFVNVKLMASNVEMDEVVVSVPYGSIKKKAFTGSEGTVSAKQLNASSSNYSFTQALSGLVPGLAITKVYKEKDKKYDRIADKLQESEDENGNREGYDHIVENPYLSVKQNPLSTFSIDVDAASYSNVRRYINGGSMPPAGAVRIEEMVNYFKYDYPQPNNAEPFSINTEQSVCPWNTKHQLLLVGLQGKNISEEHLPAASLTFLIDVSGSMDEENKLPLVKKSLELLVDKLREQDRVAIVVYAGNAGLVLPSTRANNKLEIKAAIQRLEAGGSTAGGAGIKLAYKVAVDNFIKGGNNRVVLCTDGDFNVGQSSDDALERMIEQERKSGVFLTVLGFGMGNYQDAKMQKLADKGNGNHAYIDGLNEAKKVFLNEFGGTLFTIAKDVKFQIEFNPSAVKEYRLIGYENRVLAKEDFNDDKKDAGELGSGHTVTALYEIIPKSSSETLASPVDILRYQNEINDKANSKSNELMLVKLRYKKPDEDISKLIEIKIPQQNIAFEKTSTNLQFASAVAEFGLLLRNSEYKGNANLNHIVTIAANALGKDKEGYRKEFVDMVNTTMRIGKVND